MIIDDGSHDVDGLTFNSVKHVLVVLNFIVWDMFQTKVMLKNYMKMSLQSQLQLRS